MPKRSRFGVWPVVLMLLVGGALGLAGRYAVGWRERPQSPIATTPAVAPPAPATVSVPLEPQPTVDRAGGGLDLQSSPSGARAFVDDHDVGRTPIALRDIVVGPHRIRIAMDGYMTQEFQVVFTSAQPAPSVMVTLTPLKPPPAAAPAAHAAPARSGTPASSPKSNAKPQPAPAAAPQPPSEEAERPGLAVESRPAGARVFFDNMMIGITPLHLPDVPEGKHTVRLELRGYRPWSEDLHIVANQPHRVRGSLSRRR